jgi:GPH family glycoside/pentoside/hexuronide:cation symporter
MLMMTMYAIINIPYSAVMGVMTSDTQERSQLSSFRFVGAFGVALIVQTFTKRMVTKAGGVDEKLGWQMVMVAYGAIAALLFLACFLMTKERVMPPAKQESDIKADVRALLQNGPWITMFFMGMLVIAGFALRGGTLLYYFKYYVKQGDQAFELFMFSGGLAALAGTVLMPFGTKLLGKRTLYVVCMAGAGLLTMPYYFLPADASAAIFGLNIAISFLLGPTAPLIFVMFTDVADYGEWKCERRTTGLIMAAAMLSLKFGGAIGGFANGKILEAYDFVANQEQSAESIQGILLLMGIIPAVTTIGAAVLAMTYKLDDKMMKQIETDLLARRNQG